MDMMVLDPLDESAEENGEDSAGVPAKEELEVVDDAETESVTDESLQYQLTEGPRNEGGFEYRVVEVDSNQSGDIELPLTQPVNSTVQVLTSSLNGQFYVISNGNDAFTQSTRSHMPRVATLEIETPRNISPAMKKRDERRRVTHNEVERRRRDKINNWIAKLGKLLPECTDSVTKEGDGKANFEAQSKGGILARACDYIIDLRGANGSLDQELQENERLLQEAKSLRQYAAQLRRENSQLKAQFAPSSDSIIRN